MAVQAYMSNETWRSLNDQHLVLQDVVQQWPSIPIYVDRIDREVMLRKTRRHGDQTIFVASLAVLSSDEDDLKTFATSCKKKRADIESIEEKCRWHYGDSVKKLVALWREARIKNAGQAGGKMSADKKKANSKQATAKIADRWPMSSSEWPTKTLLKEAGVSLNTAKAHLGKRPIAQYNYQAKMKRKANAIKHK